MIREEATNLRLALIVMTIVNAVLLAGLVATGGALLAMAGSERFASVIAVRLHPAPREDVQAATETAAGAQKKVSAIRRFVEDGLNLPEQGLVANGPGPVGEVARKMTPDLILWIVTFANPAIALGIIWNMTQKPSTAGAIAAVVVAYAGGAGVALIFTRAAPAVARWIGRRARPVTASDRCLRDYAHRGDALAHPGLAD